LSATKGAERTTGGDFLEGRGQACHGLPQSEADWKVSWFWVDTDFLERLGCAWCIAASGAKDDKSD